MPRAPHAVTHGIRDQAPFLAAGASALARSMKWSRYAGRDIIPMWVADMDCVAPEAVTAALAAAVADGHFGYSTPSTRLTRALVEHVGRRFGWHIEPDWLVWLPGLVCGLNLAVRATCTTGDAVFSGVPVYPPFLSAPRHSGCALRTVMLQDSPDGWRWDFDAVSARLPGSRLWLLCHPHNPVGRVWTADELARIAALAEAHDVVVCSDEIHAELVLDPNVRHVPLACACPELAARTITLMAPSKTFNIPGLGAAFAIIPDATLRQRYLSAMAGVVPHINTLGLVAMEAAFRHAEPWRQAVITHLRSQAATVLDAVRQYPGLSMHPVEASFLAWIDVRALGLARPATHFERFGIGLSDGADFGTPGFLRLNFGCAAETLKTGLQRFDAAVRGA